MRNHNKKEVSNRLPVVSKSRPITETDLIPLINDPIIQYFNLGFRILPSKTSFRLILFVMDFFFFFFWLFFFFFFLILIGRFFLIVVGLLFFFLSLDLYFGRLEIGHVRQGASLTDEWSWFFLNLSLGLTGCWSVSEVQLKLRDLGDKYREE